MLSIPLTLTLSEDETLWRSFGNTKCPDFHELCDLECVVCLFVSVDL